MRTAAKLALGAALLVSPIFGQVSTPETAVSPLKPPDRASPRGTLETFTSNINKAWELHRSSDPTFREHAEVAKGCLDVSQVPPNLKDNQTIDSTLLLKEVLDRIVLPDPGEIPGRAEVQALGLTRWTIPDTEITLTLMTDGPRKGEFLFSPQTVERSREFFDRVRELPYRQGKTGAHYDELRFGVESRLLADIIARSPPWAKREYNGQRGWQWVILALLVALAMILVAAAIAVGRRMARSVSRLGHLVGPFLAPATLVFLGKIIQPLAPWALELGGSGVRALGLLFSVTSIIGFAWMASVVINKTARLSIHFSGAEQRPLHQQLITVVSRVLSFGAITLVLFFGGQSLGIPLTALVTGLGVGGLAVALAAQSTLENLIGGMNLFADRPVHIGDFCKFGNQLGVVEGIGLRSTRIRTPGRTVVSIPNSSFARMEIENLSQRDQNLLRTTLHLEYGTDAAQVEALLGALRAAFSADERVADDPFRVLLHDLGRDALEIQIYIYVLTNDWNEFLSVREELLLTAMRIVDQAGLRLAVPTERHLGAD